jgi:hypothetical protein
LEKQSAQLKVGQLGPTLGAETKEASIRAVVSGHTIKHVLSAVAAAFIVR